MALNDGAQQEDNSKDQHAHQNFHQGREAFQPWTESNTLECEEVGAEAVVE